MTSPETRNISNRYFKGSMPKEHDFKEFELGVTSDNFVVSKKALWNGGDGIEWVIEKDKFYTRFQHKNVHTFLENNPVAPQLLGDMDVWINRQTEGMEIEILDTKRRQIQLTRDLMGLPVWAYNDEQTREENLVNEYFNLSIIVQKTVLSNKNRTFW